MKNKGILVVVSGFAGAGKGTVMRKLLENYDTYSLSVSATSRKPRPGEEEGKSYFFRTRDEFEKMIEAGELLEYAEYVGNYYGTPRAFVEEKLEAGRDVLLEIEVQGAMQVKKLFPDAFLVFIVPPSAEELKRRLKKRGTETDEVIAERMRRAVEESKDIEAYDYILICDTADRAAVQLNGMIQAERLRPKRQADFIEEFRQDLIRENS
ncbi:MAG: guanylate kinase [Lachnospiraceae bacterium]|nr:guanylate kinase [Lachnospiraceae bacterium]